MMKNERVVISAVVVLLAACSSPPKPITADGGSRVPANDPARVQALQDRAASDRVLLSENNLLKAQVNVLQQKLNEMTTIVRDALVLPPPTPTPAKPPDPVASPAAPAALKSAAWPTISLMQEGVIHFCIRLVMYFLLQLLQR